MVVGISKRQQFRNERALQDLIRSVPGNDRCADCQAMNPGWASWNMGIFLCMRCAALHRKMGTHISKVKSLSMDSWSSEQVDNMKSHGNILMNKIFNPRNVKPPVPADVDEADACMERFIRQKYQYRSLEDGKPKPPARDDPSPGDRSPEGSPPPLPPKPNRPFGFGLRSASSATNLNRMSQNPGLSLRSPSPPPPLPTTRSASQGLDASSNGMSPASFESMMNILRDKGFQNERRNAAVLRGLDGNLEKSIETLLRLGEGSGPVSRERTPAPSATATSSSTNPFDMLDAKPQNSQPTGQPYNPFDMPTQPAPAQQPLEQSFQNLQVSQPLFPHSTGGYPNQPSQPFYQQPSATPPVPATFTQSPYVQSPQPVDHNPFFQSQPNMAAPAPAPAQPSNLGQTNPFFTPAPTSASIQQAPNPAPTSMPIPNPPRHANTMPALSSTSPFGQPSPFKSAPPAQPPPQPQLQPQQQQQQPAQLQPLQTGVSHNPFHSMTGPTTPHSAGYLHPQQQFGFQGSGFAGQLAPQPTGRVDKNSILSLYSFAPPQSQPQHQPQPQLQTQAQQPFNAPQSATPAAQGFSQSSPFNSTPQTQASSQSQPQQPAGNFQTGTRNPFFTAPPGSAFPQQQQQGLAPNVPFAAPMNSAPPTTTAFPRGHMSQQSVDINGLQNGRHSPDAFTGLSARYG